MKYYALTVLLLVVLYIFANPAPSENGFMFMNENSLPEIVRYAFFILFALAILLTQYVANRLMDEQKAFIFGLLLMCPFFVIPSLFVEQPMVVVSLFFAALAVVAFIHMPIVAVVPVFAALYFSPLAILLLIVPIKRYLEGKNIAELLPLLGAVGVFFSYNSFTLSLAGVALAAYGMAGFTSLFGAIFALLCFVFPASLPALALFETEYKNKDENVALGTIGFFMLMLGQVTIGIAILSALLFFIILKFLRIDVMHLFLLFALFSTAMVASTPNLMKVDVIEHELIELFKYHKPDMIVEYPNAYKFYVGKEANVIDVTASSYSGSIAISVESLKKVKPRNVMFFLAEDREKGIRYFYNEYYIYVLNYLDEPRGNADVYTAKGGSYVGRASITKLLTLFNGQVLVDATGFENSTIVSIAAIPPVACKGNACIYQLTK